jgi:hypothetical protein
MLVGDSSIVGTQGDEIKWKLTGEGFLTYKPVWEQSVHFWGKHFGDNLYIPFSIWEFGKIRFVHIHGVTITAPTNANVEGVFSDEGALPPEHRPINTAIDLYGTVSYPTGTQIVNYRILAGNNARNYIYVGGLHGTLSYEWPNRPGAGVQAILWDVCGWYSVA